MKLMILGFISSHEFLCNMLAVAWEVRSLIVLIPEPSKVPSLYTLRDLKNFLSIVEMVTIIESSSALQAVIY